MPYQRRFRILKLDTIWESLAWSVRASCLKFPFPRVWEDWDNLDFEPKKMQEIEDSWEFLRPFFVSRGYFLYIKLQTADIVPADVPKPALSSLQTHPHARRICPETVPGIGLISNRVWAARDRLGRDVIIKLVSEASKPSDELRILQRLNDEQLRPDPRNHTIHVLEFLKFDNFIFAVMPRWDMAMCPDFSTVSELIEFSKTMLEALDFLHEHRIAHQDILDQNVGMNVFGNSGKLEFRKGLRNPGEVRYALYDFGYSIMYPEDVDTSNVKTTRFMRFYHARGPTGPYNPFKADVALLGGMLQLRVRHVEHIIPALGSFFDQLIEDDEDKRPTARQALESFLEICRSLMPAQLEAEVTAVRWKNGVSVPKPS